MTIHRDELKEMDHQQLIELADRVGLPTHGDETQLLTRIITSSREFSNF